MKFLIAILLPISLPHYCSAQLSFDSLSKICIADKSQFILEKEADGWKTIYDIKELCPGYLNGVKILSKLYGNFIKLNINQTCDDCEHEKLYALNSTTGQAASLTNLDSFTRALRNRSITNLDKAYLYLMLNGFINSRLTEPHLYPKKLAKHCILRHSENAENYFFGHGSLPITFQPYFTTSTKNKLFINTETYCKHKPVFILHEFTFREKNLVGYKVVRVDSGYVK